MKFIAHRGLTNGPNSKKENNPEQILSALDMGFLAEVDIWSIEDNFWLGHNEPTYYLTEELALKILPEARRILFHIKNEDMLCAAYAITSFAKSKYMNYFWHDKDRFTMSSDQWLIQNINEQEACPGIINQPELHDFFVDASHLNIINCEAFLRIYGKFAEGIMTKYPILFKEAWEKIQNDIS